MLPEINPNLPVPETKIKNKENRHTRPFSLFYLMDGLYYQAQYNRIRSCADMTRINMVSG